MDQTNLAQIAYDAYCAALDSHWTKPPWRGLLPEIQRAWEAAAQASGPATPGFQFALGQQVRRTIDPEHRWEIWWRACREEHDRLCIDYGLRLINAETDYHPCAMSDGSDLTPVEDTPS